MSHEENTIGLKRKKIQNDLILKRIYLEDLKPRINLKFQNIYLRITHGLTKDEECPKGVNLECILTVWKHEP